MDKEYSFLIHLYELRRRLLWCVGGFALIFGLAYFNSESLFKFFASPLVEAFLRSQRQGRFIFTDLSEAFFCYLKVSLYVAFFISFPLIAYHLWHFVAPGLYLREKKAILPFLWLSPLLFFFGAAFAYFCVFPLCIDFFLSFEQGPTVSSMTLQLEARMSEYLSFGFTLFIAFGFAFQLPLVLIALLKAKIIELETLQENRRYIIVLVFIIAAILTPPDVISQILLALPLLLLYEIAIYWGKYLKKTTHSLREN